MQILKNNKFRIIFATLVFIVASMLFFVKSGTLETDAAWTESAYLTKYGYSQSDGKWYYTKLKHKELNGVTGAAASCENYMYVDSWSTKNLTCSGSSVLKLKCACGGSATHTLTNAHSHYETQVGGYIHKKCHYCSFDETVRPITYTIQFNKNDNDAEEDIKATGTMNSITYTYGTTINLPENQFERFNFEFGGWLSTSSGASILFGDKAEIKNVYAIDGNTIADGSTVTLYAKWKTTAQLSLLLMGGSVNGNTADVIYVGNKNDKVYLPTPVRRGYTFVRWEGSHLSTENDKKVFTFPSSSGYYGLEAIWKLNTYNISYNGNGATDGSVPSQTITVLKENVTVQQNTFVRTGYTFKSWNTKADGSGTTYSPGTSYTALESVTLYAQWEKNQSTLIVNPAGGTWNNNTSAQSFTKGYGETLSIPTPTRDGYDFDGWVNVPLNGSITSWKNAATYTFGPIAGTTSTLTATWKEKTYTISYNSNFGSGVIASQTKSSTSSVTLKENSFSKTGYKFKHWNTKADGTGTTYNAGDTYTTNADVTLYAIWEAETVIGADGVDNHAFDDDIGLPTVKVSNLTITYDTSGETSVDFGSNTTDVAFDGWTMYGGYDDAAYSYNDYNTNENTPGNYYGEQSVTDTLAKLISFVGCKQCNNLSFHGSLRNSGDSLLRLHFDYDHNGSRSPITECQSTKVYGGNWANNSGENKGETRNSLAVASFKGSWKLVLPNAYKTGYVFTGWYAEVASGTHGGKTVAEIDKLRGTSGKYYKYIGMAGDTYDWLNIVREHNTNVNEKGTITSSPTGIKNFTTGVNNNLTGITLYPRFEPIHYKILYVMNIPSDSDASTAIAGLQSHTTLAKPASLTNVHSLKYHGGEATKYYTGTDSVGSTNYNHKDYSYIGEKTYIYDGTDWTLENMPITVNDYYFTGWTYDDIVWTGYGGMQANGVVLGSTRIGNSTSDTHDIDNDYSLRTLSMSPNVVQNIKNNLPHTANSNKGLYTKYYTVPQTRTFAGLANPQSDGTNSDAGAAQLSELNIDNPTVYIVLKGNWTDEPLDVEHSTDITYHANNDTGAEYYKEDAYSKLTEYIDVLHNQESQSLLSHAGFGKGYNKYIVDSSETAVGDTSNDGSYDYNATSDRFMVNPNGDKYYSGMSNGRNGFFSFQGWSTWKYATWRDAIDSNKKDTNASELQFLGADSGAALGHDGNTIHSSFTSGVSTIRRYNDVTRSKRVGDLYYRMAAVLYPDLAYNGGYEDNNADGSMLNSMGTGENYHPDKSTRYWSAYKWRWEQGDGGHYAIPINGVLDEGIHLYAIWDAYPTSFIENTYVYLNDEEDNLEKLTPSYLFSKVIAFDYEDFWNQQNYSIGEVYGGDGSRDWGNIASASAGMNVTKGSLAADGDYTYTYNIKGDNAYMSGKFTATLVDYDYDRFVNATFVDDVAAVSVTFKFVDSAGNTTTKTAWVYIIDDSDEERDDDPESTDPGDPDNTRYSMTRFINYKYYHDTAQWDANGNYVVGSADEANGSLLERSKWYLNNSYKDQLLSALERLETVGGSSMRIDANILDLWGGKANYVNDDGSIHTYHPQLLYDANAGGIKWQYDFDALKTQTEGVYVLDYEDIVGTKQFIQNNDFDTGNYSGHTVQDYIDSIFSRALPKDEHGQPRSEFRVAD